MSRITRVVSMVAVALLVVLVAAGCQSAEPEGSDQMHGNAPLPSASITPTAPAIEEDPMLHTSDTVVSGKEVGVIETSKGTIKVEFYAADAPNTVASFIELADAGFYDGIKFHRVIARFVVQGGDPQTRDYPGDEVRAVVEGTAAGPMFGTGGPGWTQKAEFNNRKHVAGTLAMARSQSPDSAGSQFYICLEPQPSLDNQYTVFGQVIEGMDVVRTIEVGDEILSITIER